MENVSKAIGIGRDLVIIAFLVLVVAYYGKDDKLSVYIVEQKKHQGLIERLFERVDGLNRKVDDQHQGLLERLKILEKKRGDIGEKP